MKKLSTFVRTADITAIARIKKLSIMTSNGTYLVGVLKGKGKISFEILFDNLYMLIWNYLCNKSAWNYLTH